MNKERICIITSVHPWNDTRIFYKEAVSLAKKYEVELHAPADFGWFGIIRSSFFIGFFVHLFYHKLLYVSNYTKNIIYVTISSITVMTFSFTFISSSFTTLLLTRGLVLNYFFLYVCKFEQSNMKCDGE